MDESFHATFLIYKGNKLNYYISVREKKIILKEKRKWKFFVQSSNIFWPNWKPKLLIVLSLLNDLVCGLRLNKANLSKIFATFPSNLTVCSSFSSNYLLILSTFKWLVCLKSSLNNQINAHFEKNTLITLFNVLILFNDLFLNLKKNIY